MKVTIDTSNRTIELAEEVSLQVLMTELKKLRPDDWASFKILPIKTLNNFLPYTPTIQREPFLIEPYYLGDPTCVSH